MVNFTGPSTVTAGSTAKTGWSFPTPILSGYRGWAQSWNTPATKPQFDGPTAGWMNAGVLSPGTYTPVVTFFYGNGKTYPVYGPAVTVTSFVPPAVHFTGPSTVAEGSSAKTGWSFTAPIGPGYQGWAQSWNAPATKAQFDGPVGGWMPDGVLAPGTYTPVVTFFYNGGAYPVYGPTVTVAPFMAPPVHFTGPSTVIQGSTAKTGWSFTAPSVPGYQGWAQSWNAPATKAQFDGPVGGWMPDGVLAPGTYTPVVTFFVNGNAYPVYGPTVTVAAFMAPPVHFTGPSTVMQGSSAKTGWSFTAPIGAGYQGWAQSWNTPATKAQFDGPVGGWMNPGVLAPGTYTPVVTFFYNGKAYPMDGPTVTVAPFMAPPVHFTGPSTVAAGSTAKTGWSFTAPIGAGYQGWAQSWNTPATKAQFDGPVGGWMNPGVLTPGTYTPVVTFFYNGKAYPVDGPTVTVTSFVPPAVHFTGPSTVAAGSTAKTGWSFTAPIGAGYQGWAQSWNTPATKAQFNGPVGGWMNPGVLAPGTYTPVVTFFYNGGAYSVYGPTVTVTKA